MYKVSQSFHIQHLFEKTMYLLLFQSELEFLKIKYTADYMPSVSSFLKEKLRPP